MMMSHKVQGSPSQSPKYNDSSKYPSNEEWSLIYKQIAKQSQVLQDLQKFHIKKQKMEIKQHLDKQIAERYQDINSINTFDKKYKEYIDKKVKQQQERQKYQIERRRQQRKNMEVYNKQVIKNHQTDKLPQNKINKSWENKSLEQSQIFKKQQDQVKMLKSIQLGNQNKQSYNTPRKETQSGEFNQGKLHSSRYYHDGADKVFNIYSNIVKQQNMRKRQQQYRLMQDALKNKQKLQQQQAKKNYKLLQEKKKMKQVLDWQIQEQYHRNKQQKKVNPQEEISYKLFSNLNRQPFKPKKDEKLAQVLQAQSQQQRERNYKSKYMTQQQYKINIHQLNKAVNKVYDPKYDRSLNTIGQRLRRFQNQGLKNIINYDKKDELSDQEQQIVRRKIQMLNMRRRNSVNEQQK